MGFDFTEDDEGIMADLPLFFFDKLSASFSRFARFARNPARKGLSFYSKKDSVYSMVLCKE